MNEKISYLKNYQKLSTPFDCKLHEHELEFMDYHPLKLALNF